MNINNSWNHLPLIFPSPSAPSAHPTLPIADHNNPKVEKDLTSLRFTLMDGVVTCSRALFNIFESIKIYSFQPDVMDRFSFEPAHFPQVSHNCATIREATVSKQAPEPSNPRSQAGSLKTKKTGIHSPQRHFMLWRIGLSCPLPDTEELLQHCATAVSSTQANRRASNSSRQACLFSTTATLTTSNDSAEKRTPRIGKAYG